MSERPAESAANDRPAESGSPGSPGSPSPLHQFDAWMASHPYHPRLVPFVAFVLMLWVIGPGYGYDPRTYPFLITLQAMLVAALLWRYRRMMPEITLRFHWTALAAGVGGAVAWIGLGLAMVKLWPAAFESEPDNFLADMPGAWGWVSLIFRLCVMALIVPIFEEVFFRSALLRSLQERRTAKVAVIQFLEDLPGIGDRVMQTKASQEAAGVKAPLETAFYATPLGKVTLFAIGSTLVLWCLLSHLPRDWPGTIGCGLLYIWVCWYTNRGEQRMGLGPVIWAHGLTNALLVAYTLWTDDWQFL